MFGNSERRTQQWFKMVDPPGRGPRRLLADHRRRPQALRPRPRRDEGQGRQVPLPRAEKDGKEVAVWDWENYYDVNVDEQLFDEYRRFTRIKHKDLAPYAEYVKARGLRWPVVQQPDGTWRETRFRFVGERGPVRGEGQGASSSTTRSRKDDRAQIWFRPYEPPAGGAGRRLPVLACAPGACWSTGTPAR